MNLRGRHIALLSALLLTAGTLPATAHAQSGAVESSEALELNLGTGPERNAPIVSLPPEAYGSAVMDLDLSDASSFSAGEAPIGMDYTRALNAGSALGLDLELEPRAALRFSDEEGSALVGAVVRIGDELREDGKPKKNTWYLFAGADAEAMTYSPNSVRRLTSGEFGWQDRVIVGDAQAGIGYRLGDADVSVGYYRREVSSIEDNDPNNDFSISEDAAAVSFTWRR